MTEREVGEIRRCRLYERAPACACDYTMYLLLFRERLPVHVSRMPRPWGVRADLSCQLATGLRAAYTVDEGQYRLLAALTTDIHAV